jgi:NADPH:quinone reductase-like Zn-dependent oxidoreductase
MYRNTIKLPTTPGFEGVGVITDVGSGVTLKPGQKVLVSKGEGTWQEYVKMSSDDAVVVPDEIPDEYAAQLYINPLTAWLIATQKIAKKDVVIGNAANSTMGMLFCQFSKLMDFNFIAVVRNSRYAPDLLRLGAVHVINSQVGNIRNQLLEITRNRLADVALDAVGGRDCVELAECLHPEGKCIIYGNLSMQPSEALPIKKRELFFLRDWIYGHSSEERMVVLKELMHFLWKNKIELPVAEKISLTNFRIALEHLEPTSSSTGRLGKIILV